MLAHRRSRNTRHRQCPPGWDIKRRPFRYNTARDTDRLGGMDSKHMNVIAVELSRLNGHVVRPGYLAYQLSASLPHIAPEDGESIFRNPYNVVLAVPDCMAAALVALHDPV